MRKVLIANRGEIAVRVARACRDAGLGQRRRLRRPGPGRAARARSPTRRSRSAATTPGDDLPRRRPSSSTSRRGAGADAVHPGYGFLAENADFAQAVIDAGLTWIGPPPAAIEALGDKVQARHIAQKVGAPLVPGTARPGRRRRRGRRVRPRARPAGRHQGGLRRRRARAQGRPHARGDPRAVRLGRPRGGRRLRPRRVLRRALPRPAAARRDPVPGRQPRQRRRGLHPRLLAAAPPPEARRGGAGAVPDRRAARAELYARPRRSCARPGYVGAGHLRVPRRPDGTISFLEVNTRLQVEHPVTEEVTGLDLVREMFRIADGEALGYDDPVAARPLLRVPDQRRGRRAAASCPRPAPSPRCATPAGPGVRVDAGYEQGERSPAAPSTRCSPS